jgi:hypothetical protein
MGFHTIEVFLHCFLDEFGKEWAGEFGYTFGVAIRVYCPENQWFIDSLR